ncbi:MAG: hypothetical protein WCD81_07330 [Candidatus Bathyarchaeia archaeon]
MRVPIRIISIATSAFWIFLLIFSASAIYSMKDFQVNLGQPQTSTTEDHELLFSFPVSVVNTGLYEIADFNISRSFLDEEGSAVAGASIFIPVIGQGQTINVTQNVKLNVTDLLQTHQSLLNNDTDLTTNTRISMLAAGVIPVQASSNSSMQWGAPLYNLTLGTPQLAMFNATYSVATVQLTFENHAFFDLSGTVWLRAYSNANELIGQGQTSIQVAQHSPYDGNLEVYVPSGAGPIARLEVYFVTTFFNYEQEIAVHGD